MHWQTIIKKSFVPQQPSTGWWDDEDDDDDGGGGGNDDDDDDHCHSKNGSTSINKGCS